MNNKNVICHIVGFNPKSKKKFLNNLNNKNYEIIDLDKLNDNIFKDNEMDKMFKRYTSLKKNKNDKYKDIEKKMTKHWESKFINLIENNLPNKKKIILIGNNNHYKLLSKKVELPTTNKFIIKSNDKEEVREIIKHNLKNHKKEIIRGFFPINYLDFDYLLKRKKSVNESYIKSGYLEKSLKQINEILNLLAKKRIAGKGLYISLKEQYNINSKIHPKKNDKIFAYSEPILALLGSFNWKDEEISKVYENDKVKLIEKKNGSLNKLKKKRFLYLVEKDTFIPHEKGGNIKFFSQAPVIIVDKDKIDNVYSMMNDIGIFN